MNYVVTFATDARTAALCLLILADLITGVWSALVLHKFAGEKFWGFLKTDVLALIGYATIYILTEAGLWQIAQPFLTGLHIDPNLGPGATEWSVFVIAVGSLLTSARKNVEDATGWVLFPRRGPIAPQP